MNVVCLVVDGLQAGYLGCYGNTWVETPEIDRLAAEAFCFDQALLATPDLKSQYPQLWWNAQHPYQTAHAQIEPRPTTQPAGETGQTEEARCPLLLKYLTQTGVFLELVSDDELVVAAAEEWFDETVTVDPQPTDQMAPSVDQTQLAEFFAVACDRIQHRLAQDQPFLLWLHCQALTRVWDAPWTLRLQYVEEVFEDDPYELSPGDEATQQGRPRSQRENLTVWGPTDAVDQDAFQPLHLNETEPPDAQHEQINRRWTDPPPEQDDRNWHIEPEQVEFDPSPGDEFQPNHSQPEDAVQKDPQQETAAEESVPEELVPPFLTAPEFELPSPFDPDERLLVQRGYAAQMTVLDTCLGPLLELFRDARQPTAFLLTSARGYPLGEHHQVGLSGGKCLYGELVHLPLIVRLPDGTGWGERTQALVQPTDIPLTVLELLTQPQAASRMPAGGSNSRSVLGKSLVPLIEDDRRSWRDRLVLGTAGGVQSAEMAIRTRDWYLRLPRWSGWTATEVAVPTDCQPEASRHNRSPAERPENRLQPAAFLEEEMTEFDLATEQPAPEQPATEQPAKEQPAIEQQESEKRKGRGARADRGTPAEQGPEQPSEGVDQAELYVKPDDRWEANDVAVRCVDEVEALRQAIIDWQRTISGRDSAEPPPLPEPLAGDADEEPAY